MLKAHAEAWHVYDGTYRKQQGGRVGVALSSDWAEPTDPSAAQDVQAAERYLTFTLGWFAHPVFVDGDYPSSLKKQIEQKRAECGEDLARLPTFTQTERLRIKGTADFFGLNHHTSRLVNESRGGCSPGPQSVGDFEDHADPDWPTTAAEEIRSVPWGLRRLLNFIAMEYTSVTKVPIYITGNGMPTGYEENLLNDTARVHFLKAYINEAMKGDI